MNDRDPFDAVPSNDIERLLDDAFRSRPMLPVMRPSITDVQRRARRRQQRRSGAMLGALAVMGVGGAVALASRGDGKDRTALTPGDDAGVASTVACYSFGTTTFPPTTMAFLDTTTAPAGSGTYTIIAGDIPSMVAQKFGITLEALNAANANTTGYEAFYVGLTIVLPAEAVGTTTTVMFPPSDPCAPAGGSYHCTGPLGTDDAGAQVFAQCTFFPDFIASTTTSSVGDPQSGSTVLGEFDPNQTATSTTSIISPDASIAVCDFPPVTSPVTTVCATSTSGITPTTSPAVDPNVATTTTTLP